jgi:hypothetical protein
LNDPSIYPPDEADSNTAEQIQGKICLRRLADWVSRGV